MNTTVLSMTFALLYVSCAPAMNQPNSGNAQPPQQQNQPHFYVTPAQEQKRKTTQANNEKGNFKYFKVNGKKFVTDY